MADAEHKCFTVSTTAYLRNLDDEVLNERSVAIHYQDAPKKTATGTSHSMRWPLLILAHYVEGMDEEAEKIAAILNAHYDDRARDLTAAAQLEHSGLISREKYNHIVENIRARESIRGAMA